MTNDADNKYQNAISMLKANSVDLAIRKLQRLSKEGDGHADAVLGVLYEYGRGNVKPDERKALECYRRSVDSVGSLQGLMGIGRISTNGPKDLRDPKLAFEVFSLAANGANSPQAWLALGRLYMKGVGTPRDLEKAAALFQRAAQAGNVHGHNGLAAVALKQGKLLLSIRHRMAGFARAMFVLKRTQDGGDDLKEW
ncbi:tetratricopeptide repeat protein [Luteimonas sp. 8-5]|uniref:tetratricopeptide repeat protein n=1 Tax=Luteimonas sp. 8-5 TaxID=3039387 RepID=UPI0024371B24|nr:tetratricopeptide repeat protein [Luteimonas sp. 8-5]MDG6349582.1 tetratricopeptide repeat protein [Luteimonas sp. 8-5]